MTPFDISKSVTKTKEDLFTTDELFEKEYVPFVVNRILANSPQTAFFAGAMNQHSLLSKHMQYKFYLAGIPKSTKYTEYIKKEKSDVDQEHLDFICESMNLSLRRALEVYELLGKDVIVKHLASRGGKK